MRYEGRIFRPPSEAYSYILQVTVGCAHNKCTFCSMYKEKAFHVRPMEDILEDLHEAKRTYGSVRRIFLADGDALCLPTDQLAVILRTIRDLFADCERVGVYATPGDILRTSVEDLRLLKDLGLGILYVGLESGSDRVLRHICKGVSSAEMIEAAKRAKQAGLKLSVTVITGLGGADHWQEHAVESARVLSAMDPDYIGLLTLMVEKGTPLEDEISRGAFTLLHPQEVLAETRLLLEKIDVTHSVFRSNHPSNYLSLKGTLPEDRQSLLELIDKASAGHARLNSEQFRRL